MRTVQLFLLSIIGFLVATVTSQTLKDLPQSVHAKKNDNITLTCEFSNAGGSAAKFKWYHKGRLISFDTMITSVNPDHEARYTLRSSSSRQQLFIQKVIDSDGGVWSCEPTIGRDTYYTETILVVEVPPSLVNRTQQEEWTQQLGSSLQLYCNASGNPTPTVTWTGETKANGIVLPDGTVTEYFIGNALKLLNVSAMHHGKYTCHASNGLKSGAYAEYTVNVPHAPSVSVSASSVRAPRNRMFEIGCIVSSFPKVTSLSDVQWTKDGVAISNNANGYEYSIIENTEDVTSKSILALPKVDSSVVGTYTCHFTNTQGMASASITVEAGPAIIPDTGASTSGVAHISAMAYLNLVMMAAGSFIRFIW